MMSAMLQIRGGVSVDRYGKGAGKGALIKWEHAPCIAAAQDTTLFVFYDKGVQSGGGPCLMSETDAADATSLAPSTQGHCM